MLKKLKSLLLLSYSFFAMFLFRVAVGLAVLPLCRGSVCSAVIPVDLAVTLFYFHASFVVAVKPVGH